MRTGFTAWKIAKGLYLVPLLIAYSGIISWDTMSVLEAGLFAILGTYAFVGAMEGYLEGKVHLLMRLLLIVIGCALVWPETPMSVRLACCGILIGFVWYSRKHDQPTPIQQPISSS